MKANKYGSPWLVEIDRREHVFIFMHRQLKSSEVMSV